MEQTPRVSLLQPNSSNQNVNTCCACSLYCYFLVPTREVIWWRACEKPHILNLDTRFRLTSASRTDVLPPEINGKRVEAPRADRKTVVDETVPWSSSSWQITVTHYHKRHLQISYLLVCSYSNDDLLELVPPSSQRSYCSFSLRRICIKTSVDNYFTRQYIPEDNSEHHTRRRENLKSHMYKIRLEIDVSPFVSHGPGSSFRIIILFNYEKYISFFS
jgi:hypothetical protein